MPRKSSHQHEPRAFLCGKRADAPLFRAVQAARDTAIHRCDYCGRPMNASDRNDFGTLCETCYMKEYYGKWAL